MATGELPGSTSDGQVPVIEHYSDEEFDRAYRIAEIVTSFQVRREQRLRESGKSQTLPEDLQLGFYALCNEIVQNAGILPPADQ